MREETRCRNFMGSSFRLAARDLLYASSHRQDNSHHGLCYTCCGARYRTKNRTSALFEAYSMPYGYFGVMVCITDAYFNGLSNNPRTTGSEM